MPSMVEIAAVHTYVANSFYETDLPISQKILISRHEEIDIFALPNISVKINA